MDGTTFQAINFALSLSLVLAILYIVLLVHYELFLSPLSRYPGPLLARITPLHNLYHAFKKDIHLDVVKQHQTYGAWNGDPALLSISDRR
jgi:glucan phosphoethanolaminetransferase (alkaline phosphatase superfamily)